MATRVLVILVLIFVSAVAWFALRPPGVAPGGASPSGVDSDDVLPGPTRERAGSAPVAFGPVAEPAHALRLSAGALFHHDIRFRSESRVPQDADGSISVDRHIVMWEGCLTFRVSGAESDNTLISGVFRGEGWTFDPAEDDWLPEILAGVRALEGTPFEFLLASDGAIPGVRFGQGTRRETRLLCRSVLCAFRHVRARGDVLRFERPESDIHGTYRACYDIGRSEAGLWRSRRTKHDMRPPGAAGKGSVRLDEMHVRSLGEARFDPATGAWQSVDLEEECARVPAGTGAPLVFRFELHATRRAPGPQDPPPPPALRDPGPWEPLHGPDPVVAAHSDDGGPRPRHADLASYVAALRGTDLAALLAGPGTDEQQALLSELAELFRRQAEACVAAGILLRDPEAETTLVRLVAQSLAESGTPAAEAALESALRDGSLRDDAAERVLQACFSFPAASGPLILAMSDLARRSENRQVAGTGLLMMGVLLSRARGDEGAGVGPLLDLEADCEARGRLPHWLAALDNAQSAAAAERARRHVDSTDPQVRRFAVQVLRWGGEEDLRLIARAATRDPSAAVVESCVEALATGWTGFGRTEILRLAAQDPASPLGRLCLAEAERRMDVDPEARAVVEAAGR